MSDSVSKQLRSAALAVLSGPERKGHVVNGHEFNIKPAAIVGDGPKTVSMRGQLSHCLSLRSDDQIYYSVAFKDGQPRQPQIEIDHGGVSALLKVLVEPIEILGFSKIKIGRSELNLLKPEHLADAATAMGRLVEGRGWEGQAAAIIELAALLAPDRAAIREAA